MMWRIKKDFIIKETGSIDMSLLSSYISYDLYEDDDIIHLHKSLIPNLNLFLKDFLEVPEIAPFDIVVDLTLSQSYRLLCYNEYRDGNGSILTSEILNPIINLIGLNNQYILPMDISTKYIEINKSIDTLNQYLTKNKKRSEHWYEAVKFLQSISSSTSLKLHSSLLEKNIHIPNEIKIDIKENKSNPENISIIPYIETEATGKIPVDLDSPLNKVEFNINRQVRKENKQLRVIVKQEIKNDLSKLKEKSNFSISSESEEDRKFLSDPQGFLNVSSIDFSSLSERVIEIGQYNPQYYSFLIPGARGKWIPNIQIENSVSGKKTNIQIETKTDLKNFEDKIKYANSTGAVSIMWKGDELPVKVAETLVSKFDKAFQKAKEISLPTGPIRESQTLVLVIHENTTELEYSEYSEHDIVLSPNNTDFKLFEICNLRQGVKLRDHQSKGVATIQYLMDNPLDYNGVLLADDMGLGKTIQVLYLIEYYAQSRKTGLPCIIVAPVSLLKNWEEEYLKFFEKRSYEIKVVRGGDIPKGELLVSEVLEDLRQSNLILTNYETFRDAQLTFGQVDFGILAIDEAQRIKTPGTMITSAIKAAKAQFKIAMTGTPVENTMVDLWSIIDFIEPGLFNSAKTFHSTYQKPMEDTSADHSELVANLRAKIGLQFIRRLKVDVAKELPQKNIHLVKCPLTKTQIDYYNRISSDYHSLDSNNPLTFIHKLKLLCDCPLLLDYNLADLSVNDLSEATARVKALKPILDNICSRKEKVILFSEYRKTQDMLQKIIMDWFGGINPYIINGTTSTEDTRTQLSRQTLIDKFQATNGFDVIIMSPVAAGVGLNVTAANHVVHYSRHWNPAKEAQATDRAYRIGQTKDVQVYYLISTHQEFDTFDVILANLLQKKEHLSDKSMYPSTTIEVSETELISAIPLEKLSSKTFLKEYNHSEILKFEPLQFEAAIGAIYLKSGIYDSVHLTPRIGDKGADIICFSEKENLLIQVKQSKNNINADGIKDLEIAQLTYPRRYNRTFKSILISNSNLTKGAQEVLGDSKTEFLNVRQLMNNFNVNSISYNHILKIKNSRIQSFN